MTKWFVGVTHRIRRKHKKFTLGGLILADFVGREIDLCGHVSDDWRVSAGYHERVTQLLSQLLAKVEGE